MKTFYIFLLVLTAFEGRAQFTKAYTPSNWTTTKSAGSSGSINTAAAPSSITITGSDGAQASNINTDYTITAIAPGVWSFHWAYHTNDSDADPQYDLGGLLINGVFTQLTSNTAGLVDQSGNFSQSVAAGTTIGFRIQATDNIFGNATFAISAFSPPGGVLPLRLTSFAAKPRAQGVLLNWTTASEQNFSHFVAERSTDGTSFMALQTIPANPLGQYSYLDEQATGGLLYYRLQMVDRDGGFNYSPVVRVRRTVSVLFTVYPNPAQHSLTVRLQAERAMIETLSICSTTGAVLATQTLSLQQGVSSKQLDISNLPKGVYFIRLGSSQSLLSFIRE